MVGDHHGSLSPNEGPLVISDKSRTTMFPRRACRALAVLGAVALAAALAPAAAQASNLGATDPSDVLSHPYRHGVVPTTTAALPNLGLNNLRYGGGTGGVGVTTGAPKVYLVFWGSQWGTQGSDAKGNATFTGDPQNTAPILQGFFKGLGTSGDSWSGVMTQYCEGVASGSTSCPSGTGHVGYPTGGALAGVWVDPSAAAPSQATGNQIGAEAVKAAGHFGNTTAAANRNIQYVVLSPTGTHPDGFNTTTSQFCAWHDYTGDTSLSGGAPSSPYGPLAFTNEPYVTDMGSSCGSNFVNAGPSGVTDGVTIVEGHEYAETITDQFPAGGWTDLTGYENGDKCAWISSGQGASQNISLSTGSYPVQSTWANDFNGGQGGCEVTHPTVS
jgi:serine protease